MGFHIQKGQAKGKGHEVSLLTREDIRTVVRQDLSWTDYGRKLKGLGGVKKEQWEENIGEGCSKESK